MYIIIQKSNIPDVKHQRVVDSLLLHCNQKIERNQITKTKFEIFNLDSYERNKIEPYKADTVVVVIRIDKSGFSSLQCLITGIAAIPSPERYSKQTKKILISQFGDLDCTVLFR